MQSSQSNKIGKEAELIMMPNYLISLISEDRPQEKTSLGFVMKTVFHMMKHAFYSNSIPILFQKKLEKAKPFLPFKRNSLLTLLSS